MIDWDRCLSLYEKFAMLKALVTVAALKTSCLACRLLRKDTDSPSMSSPRLGLFSKQCSSFSCSSSGQRKPSRNQPLMQI